MRIHRRFVVVLMMLGFLFAQIVATAHACPLLAPQADVATQIAAADRASMPADCPAMTAQPDSTSTANACALHCNAGQQIDVQSAALAAPIALQLPLTIRVVELGIPDALATIWFSSLGAAPPLSLLFGHFLI